MRRTVALLALLAALVASGVAAGALQPIVRTGGEVEVPRVRTGIDMGLFRGLAERRGGPATVRVVVRLADQPVAAWNRRRLAGRDGPQRLDVRAPAARRYLAVLERRQAAAVRAIRRAVPSARVGRTFRVLLNAVTVELPVRQLARLALVPGVTKVYPSLRYSLRLNRGPALIGATAFAAATGASGAGVKIAIVDDGIDTGNAFFDPSSFAYPEGFPKGNDRYTTPKVIVARSFATQGTPAVSALPFDPEESFHGSHVAGIAAGNAGTAAPPGDDHPATGGLSGVAPRAWLGNYRVFNLPTPTGQNANTPEIVAAFEQAVIDGMDVINFSGGGTETEPANDALLEAVTNAGAAGVLAVIAAGNDRDEWGAGSVGSPGTAPDALAVAAVSNDHVFAPALTVDGLGAVPYQGSGAGLPPEDWSTEPRDLVDVASLGADRRLCAPSGNPNGPATPLAEGSLTGAVALVARGTCTFDSKARRAAAAGAVGIVFIDNRAGEASPVPTVLPIPSLMVSDLDGVRIAEHLAGRDGRAPMLAGQDFLEHLTGRGGVVTSFSSLGPTDFTHSLKPDLAAPGGAVLSSTNPAIADSPFAVFDGTSMATPHVAGAVALLLQRHPAWTPAQLKSALVTTAGTAWADSARTVPASVTLAGGGLADVVAADDPRVFAAPASVSFGDLNVNLGSASATRTVLVSDAGGGAGTWSVSVRPQSQPGGVTIDVPATLDLPAGDEAALPLTLAATAGASAGDAYGMLVLTQGGVERRIPYLGLITRPGLQFAPGKALAQFQLGDTRGPGSRAEVYRFPAGRPSPPEPGFVEREPGAEDVYTVQLDIPVVNFGVAVEAADARSRIDPFILGSPDENDVQGATGLPYDVNPISIGATFGVPNGAAGILFPAVQRYYVSVDSPVDPYSGRLLAGRYLLRAWVDDLFPPAVRLQSSVVGSRRPIIITTVLDGGAGVDPFSLGILYRDVFIGAAAYDPVTGLALFPVPAEAPRLRRGRNEALLVASDFQESKNVLTVGTDIYPNTTVREVSIRVAGRPVVTWLDPEVGSCVSGRAPLSVVAEGPRRIRLVRFYDGADLVAADRSGPGGIFSVRWQTQGESRGRHSLRAVAVDARGDEASARRAVRVCR